MLVNPATSANSTVMTFRSPTSDGGVAAPIGEPHAVQKAPSGGLATPQLGHARAIGAPHDPQNLAPAAVSVPHAEQLGRPSTIDATLHAYGGRRTARVHAD
jgi:hypothetical protein